VPLRERDLSIPDLGLQFFREVSSVDGRLMRSVRALLTRPGWLSAAHVAGQRRAFFGPLPLFLVANGLFVAVQSLTHANIFSSPLESHLHNQDWSPLVRRLVADRFAGQSEALAAYAAKFDRAAMLNAKALVILMALAFTPFLAIAFRRAGRAFGAHLVFALHLYAFILMLMCVALAAAEAQLLAGGLGLASPRVDLAISVSLLLACGAYLYLAIGVFYDSRGVRRIAKTILLAASVGLIVVAYRFAIFLISFATT
jgi:hypothetical protein